MKFRLKSNFSSFLLESTVTVFVRSLSLISGKLVACLENQRIFNSIYFLLKKTSEHAKEDAVDLKNTQLRMEREKQVSLLSLL
jgi:hypothetical protein